MARRLHHSCTIDGRRRDVAPARELLAFALPLVLTQAVVVVNQLADLWVVGSLGREALAAVGVAGYALMVPASLGVGLASAIKTQAGQARGAGLGSTSLRCGWCGVLGGGLLGLVCFALGPAVAAAYFDLLGHAASVRELEGEYFSAAAFGLVPQIATAAAAGWFVGVQRPWHALALAALAVSANLVLDVVLVFGLAGVEPMGVRGAAWAGVWASVLAAALATLLLVRAGRRAPRTTGAAAPATCRSLFEQLWRLGVPVGLQELIDVLTWGIALTWLVGLYGTADLAAAAVVLRLLQIAYQPCLGLGAAVSALVAESIGAGDRVRARLQVRTAFVLVRVYTLVLATLAVVFRAPILGWFSRADGEVDSIGALCLGVAAVFLVFDGMNIVYGEALRAAGDNRWPLLVNGALSLVVFLGGGWAAAQWLPGAGSALIWLADGAYLCALGFAVRSRWDSGAWREIELLTSPNATPCPAAVRGDVPVARSVHGPRYARSRLVRGSAGAGAELV